MKWRRLVQNRVRVVNSNASMDPLAPSVQQGSSEQGRVEGDHDGGENTSRKKIILNDENSSYNNNLP